MLCCVVLETDVGQKYEHRCDVGAMHLFPVRSQVVHNKKSGAEVVARHFYFGECKTKIHAEQCLSVGPYSTA
jgi:hypothetical protein